jgi:hypothetical protein
LARGSFGSAKINALNELIEAEKNTSASLGRERSPSAPKTITIQELLRVEFDQVLFVLRTMIGAVGEHGLVFSSSSSSITWLSCTLAGVVAEFKMIFVLKSAFTWFFQP